MLKRLITWLKKAILGNDMSLDEDPKFFEMIELIENDIRGLSGEGLMVDSFEVSASFLVPIMDATLWIILKGPNEKLIPKWCIGDDARKNFRNTAPPQGAFCDEIEKRILDHIQRFNRKNLVVDVGFESLSRVNEVGSFGYFRQ